MYHYLDRFRSSADHLEIFSSYQTDGQKLLETGVRVFELLTDFMNTIKTYTRKILKKKLFYSI